jgi:hypothetical protein
MNDESPPAFSPPSVLDLKQHPKVKPGKVTKILQYKNTHLGIVCLSTGQVVVVNFVKQTVLSLIKSHAGRGASHSRQHHFSGLDGQLSLLSYFLWFIQRQTRQFHNCV